MTDLIPEDGEVDEVQADAHEDPDALVQDADDAPLNLEGAPPEFQGPPPATVEDDPPPAGAIGG